MVKWTNDFLKTGQYLVETVTCSIYTLYNTMHYNTIEYNAIQFNSYIEPHSIEIFAQCVALV